MDDVRGSTSGGSGRGERGAVEPAEEGATEEGKASVADAAIPEAASAETSAPRRKLIAVFFPCANTSGSSSAIVMIKIPKPMDRNMGIEAG